MCLNTITKRYSKPTKSVRDAFKIMRRDGLTPYQFSHITREWQGAYRVRLSTEGRGKDNRERRYLSGWHTFPTLEDAEKALSLLNINCSSKIVPVEIKGVVYEGTDGTSRASTFTKAKIPNLVSIWIRLKE